MSQPSAPYPTDPAQGTYRGGPDPQQAYPYSQQPTALSPTSERNWAMGAHLSGFAAAYVALGFLGPLVVMLAIGDRSPYVRRHAVEALNFNLTWLLYIFVAGALAVILIGLPVLLALGIGYVVLVILAAVEASRGGEYRYPLTIRLVS